MKRLSQSFPEELLQETLSQYLKWTTPFKSLVESSTTTQNKQKRKKLLSSQERDLISKKSKITLTSTSPETISTKKRSLSSNNSIVISSQDFHLTQKNVVEYPIVTNDSEFKVLDISN